MRSSPQRRRFLKATGLSLALPLFESLAPAASVRPVRMVCIGNALGFYQPAFHPKRAGSDYDLPVLLEPLAPHRGDLTIFSSLDHGVKGGHFAIHSYLSGVMNTDAKSMPEGNISVDQRAAETIGGATRFPSIAAGSPDGIHGGCLMSWTRSGTRVPPIPGPRELFRKLFVTDSASAREQYQDRLLLQNSILDAVRGDAKSLERQLSQRDKAKLDEYFTSVRDVERQLELSKQWADIPKPTPPLKEPPNTDFVSDLPILYDLIALALQTDSTRVATLEIAGGFNASALGIRQDYHLLSHHGQVQESIDALLKLEAYQMKQFARFLEKLKSIDDNGANLLSSTMVLFGSGMGNANAHTNRNLPILLAGGGFRHGEHRPQPAPLCNLYVSMLQRFGVKTERFGISTGKLAGLEVA